MLAICRGCQVLNVALGGTLHQHITDGETTVAHQRERHDVTLAAGSLTTRAMGTQQPKGWSQHHQAIDRLGRGLVVAGRAADGVVEAVELPGRWVVGVQWHPEDTAADDPDQQRLFDAFVAECRSRLPLCGRPDPSALVVQASQQVRRAPRRRPARLAPRDARPRPAGARRTACRRG